MRKAIASPLLSAFVLPGMGQLYNQQIQKGAMLVSASSLLFLTFFGILATRLWGAYIDLLQAPAGSATLWQMLAQRLLHGGAGWMIAILAIFVPLWIFAIFDAWRWGSKLDQQEESAG